MKKILFCLLAVAFLLPACKYKTTKNAMKHGERLKASINDFEENRQKLSVKLVSSLETAEEKLTAEDPDLPKVSKDFEKEWTGIQKRYKGFKSDFEKVGKTSADYFAKLDELVNNINSEELRNEELAKNDELRQKWKKSYNEAQVSIDEVTKVLEAGNDFHMVLVASSIRQKLEQNVGELNRIAAQAKELLGDLEAFTMAGRELVEG
ncbi:MAG: hypothetical protein AAF960_02475 [Bacteroidota bacterium]